MNIANQKTHSDFFLAPVRTRAKLFAPVRPGACTGTHLCEIFALVRTGARKIFFGFKNFFPRTGAHQGKNFAHVRPGARTRADWCEKFCPGAHRCEEKITVILYSKFFACQHLTLFASFHRAAFSGNAFKMLYFLYNLSRQF